MRASIDRYRLVVSQLGLGLPAVHVLKRLGYVDHFYHLTAVIDRLRFPRLRADLRFEEVREADVAEIRAGVGRLDAASRKDVVTRLLFYYRGFSSCYVGRDARGELASMQWLIRPSDNPLLQKHFRRLYYPLRDDEVMVENVYVFPQFRALGIFPAATHHVLRVARQEGYRVCNAYIRKDNIASLNGFLGLGFQIRKLLAGYNLAGACWRTL